MSETNPCDDCNADVDIKKGHWYKRAGFMCDDCYDKRITADKEREKNNDEAM